MIETDKASVSAVDSQAHATTNGSGAAVNIILGSEAIKSLMWFWSFIVCATVVFSVAALSFSIYASTTLSTRAYALDKQSESLKTEMRLDAYWKQQVEARLELIGVSVPAPKVKKPVNTK
jgi:hypothetical protein